jgi:esterase
MRITSDRGALNIRIDGPESGTPILLLHGIISSSATWDWLVPRLAEQSRVLRLDFRGHGESDRAPGHYDMPDYLADAVAACEQVAGGPAIVIGHSLGGVTAAALAQTRPDLVRGVLLEDAPLADFEEAAAGAADGEPDVLVQGFALMRQTIPGLQAAGMSVDALVGMLSAMPSLSGGTFGDVLIDDGMRTMAAGMLACDSTVLDPIVDGRVVMAFDPKQPIEVPVTAVAADPTMPDAVTRPEDLAQLRALSPHAETYTVAGAGHLIHDSRAGRARFAEIVDDFLNASGS